MTACLDGCWLEHLSVELSSQTVCSVISAKTRRPSLLFSQRRTVFGFPGITAFHRVGKSFNWEEEKWLKI
jgi:hypothetical protein